MKLKGAGGDKERGWDDDENEMGGRKME